MRHGATEWSETGRHTSRTDVPLTAAGRESAAALARFLADREFGLVLVSPAARSRDTAREAGFRDAEVDPDLREWDYGEFEGITSAEIRSRGPEWAEWTIWGGSVPGGETLEEVAARAARILARVAETEGDVLLFGHGHQLRVLTAIALDLDPRAGAHLALDAGTLSVVGHEHETRALRSWNRRA